MRIFGMITTKRSEHYTPHALKSFFAHTTLAPEDAFFLIDNDAAFDESLLQAYPRVTLRRNNSPLGFAANGNFLIDEALRHDADLYFMNNDIIFTNGWCTPLDEVSSAVVSPLSNREVQYASSVFVPKTSHVANIFACSTVMSLEHYLGNEKALEAIAEANQRSEADSWRVYVVPFFSIKIPRAVLRAVGHFDVEFGIAGGEDFDYCLRAYLAGFEVRYAIKSFVLHFGGKSSWSGGESSEEQHHRENIFRSYFAKKWGQPLHDMILREDPTIIGSKPELAQLDKSGNLLGVIRALVGSEVPRIHLS